MQRDVDPHFVDEAEGTHGHPEIQGRRVHLFDARSVGDEPAGFVQVGTEDPVDEESGTVPNDDGNLPEPRGESVNGRDGRVTRRAPAHDLHQRHPVDRVEEVETTEVLRSFKGF